MAKNGISEEVLKEEERLAQKMENDYIRMKNIFEIWKENGEKLPFKVRRENWTMPDVFILVEKIVIKKWPYGDAFGKSMNKNKDGNEVISDVQYHCPGGKIGCAGCYQWYLWQEK